MSEPPWANSCWNTAWCFVVALLANLGWHVGDFIWHKVVG